MMLINASACLSIVIRNASGIGHCQNQKRIARVACHRRRFGVSMPSSRLKCSGGSAMLSAPGLMGIGPLLGEHNAPGREPERLDAPIRQQGRRGAPNRSRDAGEMIAKTGVSAD